MRPGKPAAPNDSSRPDSGAKSPAGTQSLDSEPGSLDNAGPRDGGMAAMWASLVMHVILFTLLGLLWSRTSKGTGEEPGRPVGIAMVHRMPDRDQYVDAVELEQVNDQTESQESASSSSAAAPPADLAPPIDFAGVLRAMTEAPSPITGTGLAGENQLDGDAFGTGPGQGSSDDPSKKTASLFGVSGFGSRFVYVVDRSDSMNGNGGRPLLAAKTELIRSLGTLTELQQFQIIFYNDQTSHFLSGSGKLSLVDGSAMMVDRAQRYVKSVRAYGGTQHNQALAMALKMSPDVIFFLTDARVPALLRAQLQQIRRRAGNAGTTIHTIEFGTDLSAPQYSFLIDLAEQNGGQYQYINVKKFEQ